MYCGIDIFSGRRYDDGGPTSSMTWEPLVERKEYQLMDLNERDVNDKGAVVSICDENGETVDDLRVPIEGEEKAEYAPLVAAIKDNQAGSGKDVYVTVLESCGQRKILPQCVCAAAAAAAGSALALRRLPVTQPSSSPPARRCAGSCSSKELPEPRARPRRQRWRGGARFQPDSRVCAAAPRAVLAGAGGAGSVRGGAVCGKGLLFGGGGVWGGLQKGGGGRGCCFFQHISARPHSPSSAPRRACCSTAAAAQ